MPEFEVSVKDLSKYVDEYEVFDEKDGRWKKIKDSSYMNSGGFGDIEKADKEVTAITISRRGEKVVFGLKPYKSKSKKVTFLHCKDEYDLLTKFLHVWQSGRFSPDVVTGWNIEFYDIPYLVNRIRNILGEKEAKKLSPWGFLEERIIELFGKETTVYVPAGINVLDYYALYRKFSFGNEESYKLDHIAEKVLGEKKLGLPGYNDMSIFLCGADNVKIPQKRKEDLFDFEKMILFKKKIIDEKRKRRILHD